MVYRHPIIIAYYLIPGLWVPWPLGSLAFGFLSLWVPSLGSLAFGFPRLWVPWLQRWRNPKAREPKGRGTQRPRNPKSLAFGFPGLWIPSPSRRERKGRVTQRPRNPKSLAFGFLRLWVPWLCLFWLCFASPLGSLATSSIARSLRWAWWYSCCVPRFARFS